MQKPWQSDDMLETVRKSAELARLSLTDLEMKTYSGQLENIVSYIQKLGSLSVDGIEPLTHPWADRLTETPLRPDQVIAPVLNAENEPRILESAAEVIDGGFKVPQVVG